MNPCKFIGSSFLISVALSGCGEPPPAVNSNSAQAENSKAAETTPVKAAEPVRELEPWEKVTQHEIDAITYEDCDDDYGVTVPFLPDLERIGDEEDHKKAFNEWKAKLEAWDCNAEQEIGQKVRNYISLMSLVDVMQMDYEGETPLVLFERMKKEIPREQLLKAVAYCALKPEAGTVLDKSRELDIEDGTSEDRVRERVGLYAKKVLGRMLGKLPLKEPEAEKK